MRNRTTHFRSRSWSVSVWTKSVAFVVAALCVAFTEGQGPSAGQRETAGHSPKVAPAESSAIIATCYHWENVYKRKWLIFKEWGHRVSAPCTDRFGCLNNAEWKHGNIVTAPGPTHSNIEGGKARDSHGQCG